MASSDVNVNREERIGMFKAVFKALGYGVMTMLITMLFIHVVYPDIFFPDVGMPKVSPVKYALMTTGVAWLLFTPMMVIDAMIRVQIRLSQESLEEFLKDFE